MKSLSREAIRRLYRIALAQKARRRISSLYRERNEALKLVANALREAFENTSTPDEEVWIERIESLRKKLNTSSTEITVTDYGAGSPDFELTDEEMYQGRILTRTIGDVCRSASTPYFWSRLLFKLIREFKPSVCLEMGTCLGISTCYQAAALKLNQFGKIVTMEGAASLAELAKQHFQELGLDNVSLLLGRFQDTLGEVLNVQESIDYAFIDGHHDEEATLAYFERLYPFLSKRALLIFDDISWSRGMKRAWKAIERDKRVKISVDLLVVGIGIIDAEIETKQSIKIPIV